MFDNIKCIILKYQVNYKGKEVFRMPLVDKFKLIKSYLYLLRTYAKAFNVDVDQTDDQLLDEMEIIELPPPNKWPISSIDVKSMYYGDIRHTKIIQQRWTGFEWEYQLERIGHVYDFFNEDDAKIF